jgi:hypothetical protein
MTKQERMNRLYSELVSYMGNNHLAGVCLGVISWFYVEPSHVEQRSFTQAERYTSAAARADVNLKVGFVSLFAGVLSVMLFAL